MGRPERGDTWDDLRPVDPDVPNMARYTRLGLLGKGGMAEVYLVRDERLGREVAYKVISSADPRRGARFVHESRLSAELDHPNVAPVYDAGIDEEGRPWFTMKRIEGRTLADHIEAKDLGTLLDRLAVFSRICDGVA